MSGGVDCSVAAALLKRPGYDVVGITLQLYDHGAATGARAPAAPARTSTTRAGSPTPRHPALRPRLREPLPQRRDRSFADSYLAGETPIPCVACNQQIKFRDLLDTARDLGADALATGHYVASARSAPAAPSSIAPPTPSATRAISCSPPRASSSVPALPARRICQGRGARARARARPAGRRQARQPGHLLRAARAATPTSSSGCSPALPKPATSSTSTAACSAGTRHHQLHRRPAPRARLAAGEPLFVVRLDAARRTRSSSARASACTHSSIMLKNVNWLGDGALEDVAERGIDRRTCAFARARSRSPPHCSSRRREYGCAAARRRDMASLRARLASSTPTGRRCACARRRLDRCSTCQPSPSRSISAPDQDASSVVSAPSMSDRARHTPAFARGAK